MRRDNEREKEPNMATERRALGMVGVLMVLAVVIGGLAQVTGMLLLQ